MNNQAQNNLFSFGNFIWWIGVVEDRNDPEQLGRLKVRIYGYNSDSTEDLPTESLYWASVVLPITSASISGIGHSPTGIVEGTTVIGFFSDGDKAEIPIVFGTLVGLTPKKDSNNSESKGFKDPNNVYPKYEEGEPDTNKLALGDEEKTIVKSKKDNLEEGIETSSGESWDEPETEFKATYPYNHVLETESGHIIELDDTKDSERIHLYHKSGTFIEIYPDGSIVTKNKNNNTLIIEQDNNVYIKGNQNITIDENSTLYIKGDTNIKIDGNAEIAIEGNCTETINGNYDLSINGSYNLTVGQNQKSETSGLEERTAQIIALN